MPNMEKRPIEVVSAQAGEDPAQAIVREWECLPEEKDEARKRSKRLGTTGVVWGHPRKITAALNGDARPFFRVENVTQG